MLKKIFTVIAMSMLCASLIAGSGKAIVPNWAAAGWDGKATAINISNISSHDLEFTITVYREDGSLHTEMTYTNFQSSDTQIGAGKTRRIYILNSDASPSYKYGYAVIEWNNVGSDDDVVGLVAYGYNYHIKNFSYGSRAGMYTLPINNGMPF